MCDSNVWSVSASGHRGRSSCTCRVPCPSSHARRAIAIKRPSQEGSIDQTLNPAGAMAWPTFMPAKPSGTLAACGSLLAGPMAGSLDLASQLRRGKAAHIASHRLIWRPEKRPPRGRPKSASPRDRFIIVVRITVKASICDASHGGWHQARQISQTDQPTMQQQRSLRMFWAKECPCSYLQHDAQERFLEARKPPCDTGQALDTG